MFLVVTAAASCARVGHHLETKPADLGPSCVLFKLRQVPHGVTRRFAGRIWGLEGQEFRGRGWSRPCLSPVNGFLEPALQQQRQCLASIQACRGSGFLRQLSRGPPVRAPPPKPLPLRAGGGRGCPRAG